jgi:FKBP-type peptidyl-prolyl cis-trans isomerase FkpA
MKEDNSWYEEQIKNQQRIDSTLAAQESILEEYALNNFEAPVYDDSTGIWFEVIQQGDEDSYSYMFSSSGQIIAPTVTIKYEGKLMDGTVFDATEEGNTSNFPLGSLIYAWQVAFLPQTIDYNGTDIAVPGLTETGLKKGSKIRFIAPSPYCYDNQEMEKVPANSPLVFTIEVVDIKNL